MTRTRLCLLVIALALLAAVSPARAQIPVDYGTAELGEVRTACFRACFGMNCSGSGTIASVATDAPFFVRGIRVGPSSSDHLCDNTPGVTTPATLPRVLNPGEFLVWDVDLVPTGLGNVHSFIDINGNSGFSLEAFVVPVSACVPSGNALCLSNDRFKTRVFWRTNFGTRESGGVIPPSSDNSGLFYFFNADNWEVLIKVLNACGPFDRFWVFAAATTNVEYTITVTDTQTDQVKTYFKPQGPPAPAITDTDAFATCP